MPWMNLKRPEFYLEILILLELMRKLIQQSLDLVVLGRQLGPLDALDIFHLLSQVCNLLVQGQIGSLQVGDLADKSSNAILALLELLLGGGAVAPGVAQL